MSSNNTFPQRGNNKNKTGTGTTTNTSNSSNNTTSISSNHNYNYNTVALSPPVVPVVSSTTTATNTTTAGMTPRGASTTTTTTTNVTTNTPLQSPPFVNNTNTNNNNNNTNTGTIRQRRMTTSIQQQQQQQNSRATTSSSTTSIADVCTDTYQCMCLLPVYPNYQNEYLEYNYDTTTTHSTTSTTATTTTSDTIQTHHHHHPQKIPRIRNRGEYYIDSYNDQSKSFTFGTNENNGIWCNTSDQAGTIMSALVWCLLVYSAATVTALTITDGIPKIAGEIYTLLVCCSLACHIKTSLSDPGSIPITAIPIEKQRILRDSHNMCGQCQTFKPPSSHHCRICNRCISKMDHHCPWMNNCVGVANMKFFILFLIYTWICTTYTLLLFGWNYFFCNNETCIFHPVVVHLVRIMTFLAIGAFLFTSSMLMNVCYGIITGIGTIDRLKKKATNTMSQSDEEPIPLTDIFGIGPYYTWCIPTDPIFDDYDRVLGYTIPQRLDRERQLIDLVLHSQNNNTPQQSFIQQTHPEAELPVFASPV